MDVNKQGWLKSSDFVKLLKSWRFIVNEETFSLQWVRKEFEYDLSRNGNEFPKTFTDDDAVYRFDFARRIFIERNL